MQTSQRRENGRKNVASAPKHPQVTRVQEVQGITFTERALFPAYSSAKPCQDSPQRAGIWPKGVGKWASNGQRTAVVGSHVGNGLGGVLGAAVAALRAVVRAGAVDVRGVPARRRADRVPCRSRAVQIARERGHRGVGVGVGGWGWGLSWGWGMSPHASMIDIQCDDRECPCVAMAMC